MNAIATQQLDTIQNLFPSAAIFMVDKDRKIRYWNSVAEQLLGFSAGELIGESCLTGNRCKQCMAGCGLSESGAINGFPISLYHKDGTLVHFKKHAYAFVDDNHQFDGGIEVLLPVSIEEKHSATKLNGNNQYFHDIVTNAREMLEMFNIIKNISPTDVPVLIRGESGTGKELVAKAIHKESNRKHKPFVAVNCASFNVNLLESELFGHKRGAFTGAVRDHIGLIQKAEGGTLFLDEIAELPIELQAKLLRVIQERVFTPLGGEKELTSDIRILSATHRSLRNEVKKQNFREDLMYRLRVVPLFIPPLRERKADISLLFHYFMNELAQQQQRRVNDIDPDAMRLLLDYEWPGNIRELRNVIEYANAVCKDKTITINDLPPEFRESNNAQVNSYKETKAELERKKIKNALLEFDGDLDSAAESLNISRTTLWRKRKKYNL